MPRTVCVISGDFDVEAVRKAVTESGMLHKRPRITVSHAIDSTRMVYLPFVYDPLVTIQIYISAPGVSAYREQAKLEVLRACVAGYDFSLLNDLLHQKLGAVHHVESTSKYYTAGGYLQFGYSTVPEARNATEKQVYDMFETLSDRLTDELVEKAKKRIVFNYTSI